MNIRNWTVRSFKLFSLSIIVLLLAILMAVSFNALGGEIPSGAVSMNETAEFDHKHGLWNKILQQNVVLQKSGESSRLRYSKINKEELNKYIDGSLKVKRKDFDSWTKEQQLAYYFNLYNALTVQKILTKYPKIKSIKDLGGLFSSPWKQKFFTLFGEKSYLDRIEHELVRGNKKYNEPRVHVAFNCASIGCPALLNEAFRAEKLETQLETAFIKFLSDNNRNRYNTKKSQLEVSKIFKWYKEDFEKGHKGFNSLKDVFSKYANYLTADATEQKKIRDKKVDIEFLDYDWNLNKI